MSNNFRFEFSGRQRSALSDDIGWAVEFLNLARWPIIVAVVIATVAGILYLHEVKPLYTVRTTVAPPSQANTGIANSASVLASVTGIDLTGAGGEGLTNFLMLLEVARSSQVAQILAGDPQFMHMVFADRWDDLSGRWRSPSGYIARLKSELRRILNLPPAGPPDAALLHHYLLQEIRVNLVERTPFRELQFSYPDPVQGAHILTRALQVADDILRKGVLDRANQQAADLQNQIQRTTLVSMQDALRTILLEQLRSSILARSGEHFAYRSVDDVNASMAPTSPNIPLVLVLSVLMGVACGIAWKAARLNRRSRHSGDAGSDMLEGAAIAHTSGD